MKLIYLKEPKMQKVNMGEKWRGVDFETFRVIAVVDIENQTWVHYMRIKDNLEYSCLEESFIHRFSRELSNERY
jgi:hypothetical protein